MEQTIPQLVRGAAQRMGSRTAIEEGSTRLSFEDLARVSLQAARAFMAAGIESGDRVALWAPNLSEWIVAALGAQSAGGVLVPLNTRMKGSEAAYVLRTSGARILCTMGEFLGFNYVDSLGDQELPKLEKVVVLKDSAPDAVTWSEFLTSGNAISEALALERIESVGPEDLSDLLFTSGTTGHPKGVMTRHQQNMQVFERFTDIIGLREGDRYLIINPFFHSFGYKAGWLSCIMRGATILPQLTFDIPEVLQRIERDRISVLPGPPTIYQSLLTHPELRDHDLSSLRLATTGAAAIPVELIRRMRSELGFETVITAYGLTESCGVVSLCRPEDEPERIAQTSGRALTDVEVRCVGPDGEERPRGEAGEIVCRGYNVMQGYFKNPEETARAIDSEGWLHTGDIGIMDEQGYIRITDRIKDMYICGGFNCYPAEIESALYGSGLCAQVAVIGIPDERLGEVGMAFLVPAPDQSPTPESVVDWCRANMANYKVPRRVEIRNELPMNASGKITKYVLREEVATR
ncbi:MAG: fatty acid--CoA ligase [bacterium TMED88]|nr:fatty acid--CoA ligase [Deltaproteobacteria bacterium]OUV26915.1 MAG: fatty acid--CoA ligase [bacterium TMED88]